MVTYGQEFAAIDIPILTTTGYYDGGQVGALYTFTEHFKHNPKADHYFLIGPYTHFGAQGRPEEVVRGYRIDPVARIDIVELRYQWFDFVFRGGKKPDLLRDRVNFQVLGANEWRHAPSVAAMSPRLERYHLGAERDGARFRLTEAKPEGGSFIDQLVDLADRKDADVEASYDILDPRLETRNSLVFATPPFERPAEVSGRFSGNLDFIVNKKDLDISVDLYEQLPSGEYFQLAVTPAYLGRASYAKSRTERRLLTPGRKHSIEFRSERLVSRQLQAGSRLVMVLGVPRSTEMQINYGTGKDVSDESMEDAKEPLRIQWLTSSYLDLPISAAKNKLPPEAVQALRAPGKVILYSLEPWATPSAGEATLQRFKVLGRTELDRNQVVKAIAELEAAVAGWDGMKAACFDPRHALRLTAKGHTYDFLLCYACHNLYVYRDEELLGTSGAAGSPKVLNGLLSAAGIPLSTSDSEEDRAAQRKVFEAAEARWRSAMPKSVLPLWDEVRQVQFAPDLKPLRDALAEELPDPHRRILRLFAWFGSGAGPWSGFPGYELIPEELLLDFPTPDLVAAAESENLSESQLEGAARLFGGWDFGQRRPEDLKTLPATLKKRLLDHALKSTDQDKLGRARRAFAGS